MSTIIVGGGIVGAAVAYFLAERREPDVTLLERAELGSGSTHAGLGGIRHQFTDELDVRLSKVASAFWRSYDDLTGARHDFRQRDYLFAVPGVEGRYIAAGSSGHRFMHAPATARLIVEEMLDGNATTLDISDLSLERFQTGRRPFSATVL